MSNRRHQPHGVSGVNLVLIITPMLDMSFQILAFFIMTYHPSALEAHIPGSLTPPENPATKSKDPSVPADPPDSVPEELLMPELDSAITVQVKAVLKDQEEAMKRKVGSPGQIFVRS